MASVTQLRIDTEVWMELANIKLNKWQLDNSPKPIKLKFNKLEGSIPINLYHLNKQGIYIDTNDDKIIDNNGSLIIHNHIDEFKNKERMYKTMEFVSKLKLKEYYEINIWLDLKNYCAYYDCYIIDSQYPNGKWIIPIPSSGQNPIHFINLKQHMDSKQITMDAINLNLSLMKWRILPNLDLSNVKNKKVALFGMGTLGCASARQLLAWGISSLTLVDKGRVTYSNPVRQNLYTYKHAEHDRFKVDCAKEQLLEIAPHADIKTYNTTIPMMDHIWSDKKITMEQTIKHIDDLIDKNDVILLLTDNRESRWLVSFLAQHKPDKLVITMALGFSESLIKTHKKGETCYFCNDLNRPSNTEVGRTLDQMCTVTRPGLAYQVTGMGAEMIVKQYAEPNGILGKVTNETRFYMDTNQTISSNHTKNKECICCSDRLLEASKDDPIQFAYKVLNQLIDIEEICGLKAMQQRLDDMTDDIMDGWTG
jgi:ubiquitin-like modifier-activating enzyme ATG7